MPPIGLLGVVVVAACMVVIQRRGRILKLERDIRRLRELAARPLAYRPPTSAEVATLGALDGPTAELRALGCTILGELVEEASGMSIPARAFADANGTSYGWIATIRGTTAFVMFSHADDRDYATRRSRAQATLASPPFVQRQTIAPLRSLADVVAAHRELAGLPTDATRFVRVTRLDEMVREVLALRARTVAWREAQPPDALLDADLRCILGKHYDALARTLTRRLAPRVPEARTVKH